MIYIKKHGYNDGACEYIDPRDIFEFMREDDRRSQDLYSFLVMVADELNYFNDNSSTAFGNPDYERMCGKVLGFLHAKHWQWEETGERDNKVISIKTEGGRLVMKIERPKTPRWEVDKRKEITQLRLDFGI